MLFYKYVTSSDGSSQQAKPPPVVCWHLLRGGLNHTVLGGMWPLSIIYPTLFDKSHIVFIEEWQFYDIGGQG